MEGLVEQRGAVQIEDVEQHQGDRQLVPYPLDLESASEPAHRRLEGQRGAVGAERDRLALHDQLARGEGARGLDQLGHGGGHLVEPAGVDPHLVVQPVDLDARAVELVLDRGLAQLAQRLGYVVRAAGQHRQHRLEEPDGELGEAALLSAERAPRHRRRDLPPS